MPWLYRSMTNQSATCEDINNALIKLQTSINEPLINAETARDKKQKQMCKKLSSAISQSFNNGGNAHQSISESKIYDALMVFVDELDRL